MPEQLGSISNLYSPDPILPGSYAGKDFCDVVQMTLRIDTARDGQSDQFQVWMYHLACCGIRVSEHHRTNLNRSNAPFEEQLDRKSLGWKFMLGDVG